MIDQLGFFHYPLSEDEKFKIRDMLGNSIMSDLQKIVFDNISKNFSLSYFCTAGSLSDCAVNIKSQALSFQKDFSKIVEQWKDEHLSGMSQSVKNRFFINVFYDLQDISVIYSKSFYDLKYGVCKDFNDHDLLFDVEDFLDEKTVNNSLISQANDFVFNSLLEKRDNETFNMIVSILENISQEISRDNVLKAYKDFQ